MVVNKDVEIGLDADDERFFKWVETCKWFHGQFLLLLITQAIMTPYKSYPQAPFKSFELYRRLDFYAVKPTDEMFSQSSCSQAPHTLNTSTLK